MKSEFGGFVGDEPAAKQSKLNSNLSELQVQNSLMKFKLYNTVAFNFYKNQFALKMTRAHPSLEKRKKYFFLQNQPMICLSVYLVVWSKVFDALLLFKNIKINKKEKIVYKCLILYLN